MKRTFLVALLLAVVWGVGFTPSPASAQAPLHQCSYCHDLHGAPGTIPLTQFNADVDLCLSCHDAAAPATFDGKVVPKNVAVHAGVKHTGGDVTSCIDCHDHQAEDGGNLKLVPRTMQSRYTGQKTVVFTARTGANSFADGNTTYDGVCEVCHTATTQHLSTGGGVVHNPGADCATCHSHKTGFQPSGCVGCHVDIKGPRRAILGEFAYTSHHIDWATAGYAGVTDIPNGQCEVCHDQSQHQSGSVRLKNADTPGTVYTLTGDPNTTPAEAAKLTPFCLSCHDGNGAGGVAPFADGLMPPTIDPTLWAASSHGTAAPIAGCFGDGTNGCHGTGHGSQKTKMLAPHALLATAPANAEQEEGFCLNCHDANGPSVIDLNSRYALPTNWVDQATGVLANINFNDRHDVQYADQLISGAKIECSDCHNPHEATAAQPWKSDPDPTGVPATTGVTPLTSFCLDCHDNFFPATVTPPTNALVDIDTEWTATDAHGFTTGGPMLSTQPGGWTANVVLSCDNCHSAHPVPTYAGAFNPTNVFGVIAPTFGPGGVPLKGWGGADWTLTNYSFSTISNSKRTPTPDADNGGVWCNSCHDRSGMIGKDNCTACHAHSDGRF